MNKGVISALSAITGATASAVAVGKKMGDKVDYWKNMSDKHFALFLMMNQWVKVKQEGKSVAKYLEESGYYKIAIYGMSFAGETLVTELEQSNIVVEYAVDQKADYIYADFDVYRPEDDLPEVDAIIVTTITFFDEVEELLRKKVTYPIICLENVLYDM